MWGNVYGTSSSASAAPGSNERFHKREEPLLLSFVEWPYNYNPHHMLSEDYTKSYSSTPTLLSAHLRRLVNDILPAINWRPLKLIAATVPFLSLQKNHAKRVSSSISVAPGSKDSTEEECSQFSGVALGRSISHHVLSLTYTKSSSSTPTVLTCEK